MLVINDVIGNVKDDHQLQKKFDMMNSKGTCEKVTINRLETQKLRMRKNTDKGSDVAFKFEHNPQLRHGDVVYADERKMILLELEPEYVGIITLKNHNNTDDIFQLAIKIGHTLGNLHRPIQVTKNQVLFPLSAETELEMLRKLLIPFVKSIDIKTDYMIFEPEEGGQHNHDH